MINTPHDVKGYKKQVKDALQKDFLRKTLNNFATSYRASRANAFKEMDLQTLRCQIAEGKDKSIPKLMEMFEAFKENAVAAGIKVHLAKDAEEANEIIAAIARVNQCKTVIKSKSMTAEETFLNHRLEEDNLEVVETDLGEYIIQLRGEGPSHMVMPAIHLSRQDVGELFTDVTKTRQNAEDIDGLVQVARKELRPRFIEADMGISGANFAVADSATLGIVTNEGNARLTTTLPRIHVALVGLDKLIPDLKSALRVLKVLPRNATGQAITSYVTWIKGANACATGPNGKKEMHVVFLDNGRMDVANDPVFAEALRCVRCGACANVCPVYRLVGGHVHGHVYIGAIGLILTQFYHGRDKARAIVKNCLNCQSCKTVCPAGIDLPGLIKKTAKLVMDEDGKTPVKNMLTGKLMKNRKFFHSMLRLASKAQKPVADGQFIRHLPMFFCKQHDFRSLPAMAKTPLRDQWQSLAPKIASPKYRIALFAGCVNDFVMPEQAKALLTICKDHNVQVDFPMAQTCCGLPAQMMNENETAKEVARQNVEAMAAERYDYVITLCASCGSHIKENYPKLLTDRYAVPKEVETLAGKLIDFSSFVNNVLKVQATEFADNKRKVTYHSPCHLCRGLEVVDEPRELLKKAGFDYIPSEDEDVCCGFGGSYSVDFPEISAELLRRKLDNVEATGADLLVTDCPGCVMQLRGGLDKRGSKVVVKHISEVLAEEKI